MELYLGVDLGTSYFKAGLFNAQGTLCGMGRVPVQAQAPEPHRCELPLPAFWAMLQQAIAQALAEANAQPQNIVALSYASQANSFVLLNRDYEPLTPLILWPDERAANIPGNPPAFCLPDQWAKRTGMGMPLSIHSAVSKLWWYQSYSGVFKEPHFMLTISDYFTFILTGKLYSDPGTASLLGLLDVQQVNWWPEAIASMLPGRVQLAQVQRTGTAVGSLTVAGAALLGLHRQTRFFMGGLDHHVAAIGTGVHTGDCISESTGTVLATVSYTCRFEPAAALFVSSGIEAQHYFNLAFDNRGAGGLEWYRNTKAPGISMPELLQQAAGVQPGCEGIQAVPVNHSGMPGYRFEGAGSRHHHGHYVRAILETIAWQLAVLLNKLDPAATTHNVVSTGGGARSPLWMAIKASVSGRTFLLPQCNEAACVGAALLAATGSGLFNNYNNAALSWVKYQEVIPPNEQEREQYIRLKQAAHH